MTTPKICAFTSVCEEDRVWLDQYFAEVERLAMPFVMHLDRCSADTIARVTGHRLCVGHTRQDDPRREFQEWDKQAMFNLIQSRTGDQAFDWAMAWDVDETWLRDFTALTGLLRTCQAHQVDVPWVNLWGDSRHLRVDGLFKSGHRVKFLTMRNHWRFDHPITNGPKALNVPDEQFVTEKMPITCIHWGMMTKELRLLHKERWDRIYTAAVGNNPYGFWNFALDESVAADVVEHDLF